MTRTVSDDLADPGLARLLAAAREKLEARGGISGVVTLTALASHEAAAIDAVWRRSARRRPRRGRPFRVPLRDLDVSVQETFGLTLEEALRLTGGALRLRPQERADRRERAEAFWRIALDHELCAREPAVGEWVVRLRRTARFGVTPWANGRGEALRAILDLGAGLPRRPAIERGTLATEVLGDPHALDGVPLGSLLESQLAAREGLDGMRLTAGERRALLARFGVLCDPASATVLTLGLQPVADNPLGRALRLMEGTHFLLTLGQLERMPLRFPRGLVVRLCENPAVVVRAESRLGPACGPIVCTGGWPGSAVCALLDTLRGAEAQIVHHGDFDWQGLAIARWLHERYDVLPWRFDAAAYHAAVDAARAPLPPLRKPPNGAPREDPLTAALLDRGVIVSEEATLDHLVSDLARRTIV